MQFISIPDAPRSIGHYSPGVISGNVIYVSGQVPMDPVTGEKVTSSFDAQCRKALDNVKRILKEAGRDLDHVVKVNAYITDINDWAEFNTIYAEYFGEHRPARAVLPVGPLHYGFKVEIEAIAEIRA
jgi:2-iminobutanoate/2-iminopropanoate deaminase